MKKKCIVLDLDNTLWGGLAGEEGVKGVALSIEAPGSGFMAFQQALLDHYNRGIILAINSRNNPADAWQVIRTHPNMILKEKNFAAVRMNWNDKADNIRELARELNIGLDSMVFIDDEPANRAQIRALVPEVETPELPANPDEYARFLNSLPYFPSSATTDEDTMRGNLYVTERLRKEAEKRYGSKEEFLASLGLELRVYENDAVALPRLAQLTEKTNQFNIDKRPLSEKQIARFIESPEHTVFHAALTDKFGDYGVIAFALLEQKGDRAHIASLLMSCRALGRGIEDAFFSAILKRAKGKGAGRVSIAFAKTDKNIPAQEFVLRHFRDETLALDTIPSIPVFIRTTHENI